MSKRLLLDLHINDDVLGCPLGSSALPPPIDCIGVLVKNEIIRNILDVVDVEVALGMREMEVHITRLSGTSDRFQFDLPYKLINLITALRYNLPIHLPIDVSLISNPQ